MAAEVEPLDAGAAAELAALAARCLPEAWSAEGFAETLARAGARAWGVRDASGALRGFALTRTTAGEVELLATAVRPEDRRRGLGRALVEAALAHAGGDREATTFLELRAGNRAARRLYQRLGFETCGTRRGYYPDGEDACLMRRAGVAAALGGSSGA